MAKGKKSRKKEYVRKNETEKKDKCDENEVKCRKLEEKCIITANQFFKSDELQEIRALLKIDDVNDKVFLAGAVVIGKYDVVKRLLKDGYFINSCDKDGYSPLMIAIKHNRHDIIDLLLCRGADISLVDNDGNTAVFLAAQSPQWDQDTFLSFWCSIRDDQSLDPNYANNAGYTLLHYTVKRQWQLVINALIKMKVNINCVTSKGVTPLMMAGSRGDNTTVNILLNANADITLEDQHGCTALCYSIAFMIQKGLKTTNPSLERLMADVNEETSKLTLEDYLKRRLDLLINPPKHGFSHIINNVLVHIVTFFTKFIQVGLDLLLELNVFSKLKEATDRHIDDYEYTEAMMAVMLELVRYCECCFPRSSQEQLADKFFNAGCGKCCLEAIRRYASNRGSILRAALLPLFATCTSKSYIARIWLQSNYRTIQPYYYKYLRSTIQQNFNSNTNNFHYKILKRWANEFQGLMETLKSTGKIITEEEKLTAKKKNSESVPIGNPFKETKPIKTAPVSIPNKMNSFTEMIDYLLNCSSEPKFCNYYSTFQDIKLEKPQKETASNINSPLIVKQVMKRDISKSKSESDYFALQKKQYEIRQRYLTENYTENKAIKAELEKVDRNERKSLKERNKDIKNDINKASTINIRKRKRSQDKFQDGINLFCMHNEIETDENVDSKDHDEWKEETKEIGCVDDTANPTELKVPEEELKGTLNYLEKLFDNIIKRYESTWKKECDEGYTEAQGDSQDLLNLMSTLPALELFHIDQMRANWKGLVQQIKDNAKNNYEMYKSITTQVETTLLEYESKLDNDNVKIWKEDEYRFQCNNKYKIEKIISECSNNTESYKHFNSTVSLPRKPVKKNGIILLNSNIKESDKTSFLVTSKDSIEPLKKCDKDGKKEDKYKKSQWIWGDIPDSQETLATTNSSPKSQENLPTKVYAEKTEQLSSVKDVVSTNKRLVPPPPGFEAKHKTVSLLKSSVVSDKIDISYCSRLSELLQKLLRSVLRQYFTEDLRTSIYLAASDVNYYFTLFTGGYFGDTVLGLDSNESPIAVKRYKMKDDSPAQRTTTSFTKELVNSMVGLRNIHIVPYLACIEVNRSLLTAIALCDCNLGEHIAHLTISQNLQFKAKNLIRQVILGLHYLHSLDTPIIHGNLKPSNVLVDAKGTLRLSDFGLHKVLYKLSLPITSSVIWWARETYEEYYSTWKMLCTTKSDIQSAGMIMHYILSGGFHPFGSMPNDITLNLRNGWANLKAMDNNARTVVLWALSYDPESRPDTEQVLKHAYFWDKVKQWNFLLTCCGLTENVEKMPHFPLKEVFRDLDAEAVKRNINSDWIPIIEENLELDSVYTNTPGGLLEFLRDKLVMTNDHRPIRDLFLEIFPSLSMNLCQLLQETPWFYLPAFEQYNQIEEDR